MSSQDRLIQDRSSQARLNQDRSSQVRTGQVSQIRTGQVQTGQDQGGIKFEISWEPNFPVDNFARNNGKKLRHHPDNNNQFKVVTNDQTR